MQAVVTGVVVPLDEVHLAVAWSEFESCTFVGVQFGLPGRFSLGAATFEECVFDRCG